MRVREAAPDAAEMNVLLLDPKVTSRSWRSASFHVLTQADPAIARHARNVFVIVDAEGLPGVSRFVSAVNRRNQLRALIVRFEAGARWLPHILERAKLRTLRNILVHAGHGTPERVLNAWRIGTQRELIADARAFGDLLVVISCEPRTYEVPFDSIKALARLPRGRRGSFQVSADGSHLHWPLADVHIDLESIRCAADPEAHARSARAAALHNRLYGRAVAEYRKRRGLRQADVSGLSERQVRRIEQGGLLTRAALESFANAHGLSLRAYLDAIAALVGEDPDLDSLRSRLEEHRALPSRTRAT
jgi:hypothetical protein